MVTINFVSIALGVHCFVLYILVKIMGFFFVFILIEGKQKFKIRCSLIYSFVFKITHFIFSCHYFTGDSKVSFFRKAFGSRLVRI